MAARKASRKKTPGKKASRKKAERKRNNGKLPRSITVDAVQKVCGIMGIPFSSFWGIYKLSSRMQPQRIKAAEAHIRGEIDFNTAMKRMGVKRETTAITTIHRVRLCHSPPAKGEIVKYTTAVRDAELANESKGDGEDKTQQRDLPDRDEAAVALEQRFAQDQEQ